MSRDTMTIKEINFCKEMVKTGFHQEKSALAAGYKSPRQNASRLLKQPKIKEFMETMKRRAVKDAVMTVEWRKRRLQLAIERGLPEDIDQQVYDPNIAITAIRELNKLDGDYAPEKHVNANLHAHINMDPVRENLKELVKLYEKEY